MSSEMQKDPTWYINGTCISSCQKLDSEKRLYEPEEKKKGWEIDLFIFTLLCTLYNYKGKILECTSQIWINRKM